jgi:hypothetical protein
MSRESKKMDSSSILCFREEVKTELSIFSVLLKHITVDQQVADECTIGNLN